MGGSFFLIKTDAFALVMIVEEFWLDTFSLLASWRGGGPVTRINAQVIVAPFTGRAQCRLASFAEPALSHQESSSLKAMKRS
jgi:hypothetical protein